MSRRRAKLTRTASTLVLLSSAAISIAAGEASGWPRDFTAPGGADVVVFQPQIDALEGDRLTGRAAVSVSRTGADEQVFGTVWFDARIETDRDTRTVAVLDLEVPRVHFADATDEDRAALTDLLEKEVPKMDLDISLDRVLTSLGVTETRRSAAEGLDNEPPEIIFATTPTVLVFIEGEPVLQPVEGTDFRRVVNSPFVIVNDPGQRLFYLFAGHDTWYRASQAVGPWEMAPQVPESITRLIPPDAEQAEEAAAEESERPVEPPAIIARTHEAELIVSDGRPEFHPMAGGELLYMSNTESDVVMEIATQRNFVLLSGRWFAAPSLDGPWSFVAPNELPESFLEIEADGEMAHLRASVAGTEEAEEAVLDSQIPQTAAIKRDSTIEVEYDGEAQFDDIQGTELQWAINTESQVIKSGNRYFAVDDGVWYTAEAPEGPWAVATEVPDAIYQQPASSPAYNTTFVYIYDSTPTVVRVGYHPGYLWSFHHRGCMFWGTGWHHPAWIGHRHFPRHATWGFHVRWDPFWGWSMGPTWSHGWFTFGVTGSSWGRSSHSAWVGASAWNAGFRAGSRAGLRAGYRAGRRDQFARNANLYNRPQNLARNADLASVADRGGARLEAVSSANVNRANLENNVFADRSGNVYRRNNDGSWQERQQGQWRDSGAGGGARDGARVGAESRVDTAAQQARTNTATGARANQRSAQRNRSTSQANRSLNRDFNARQRGAARTQSFNRGGGRAIGARRR